MYLLDPPLFGPLKLSLRFPGSSVLYFREDGYFQLAQISHLTFLQTRYPLVSGDITPPDTCLATHQVDIPVEV